MKDYKLLDLRPNRALLNSNFDGYKLSLEPIPVLKVVNKEQEQPHRIQPTESQFSFLHHQLFGFQNLLYADPWAENSVYYINETCQVQHVRFHKNSLKLVKEKLHIFSIPKTPPAEMDKNSYNISMQLVTEDHAIISDGHGTLYLIFTGPRLEQNQHWKIIHKETIATGFVIKHSRLDEDEGRKQLNVAGLHVIHNESDNKYLSNIFWLTCTENANGAWDRTSFREITSKSSVSFCALTNDRNGIVLGGQSSFQFNKDGDNSNEESEMEEAATRNYSWSQTDEDVVVNTKKIPNGTKSDYVVHCSKTDLLVKFQSEILVQGKLSRSVDSDLTTWTIVNDFLQLNLVKAGEGSWPCLIEGHEDILEDVQDCVEPLQTRNAANLTAQLEDCDSEENEYLIERLDGITEKLSHRTLLGSNPPLFTKILSADRMPVVAVRCDVDCCIWSPGQKGENWTHEGTLDAFGYILASKQQRKLVDCAPNMKYCVVLSERHVFVYKSLYSSASGLRNRSGNQVAFGQQRLVTLDGDTGEVVGMVVQNEVTFLLCESCVICLKIIENE